MGAEIKDFVALLGQIARKVALHFESGVVGADSNTHGVG
jgi:hypothetical protein